ncbi:MAG: hypothetical protein KDC95_07215, partial [Planctomycetes bacterium]|nr:hypothetical protein [Planctomycetota bacterium]
MSRALPLLVALTCSSFCIATATAQTLTGSIETKSPAGAFGKSGTVGSFDFSPANYVLPPLGAYSWKIRGAGSQGTGTAMTHASMNVYGYVNQDGVAVVGISGSARGTSPSETAYTTPTTTGPGTPGTLDFVLRYKSSAGRKGVIKIAWQSLLKFSATAKAAIDIDDNGTPEWTGGNTNGGFATQLVPVAFDANGDLIAKVSIEGTVDGAGQINFSSAYGRLDIRFVDQNAGKCTITPYGTGCSGASATASVTTIGAEHVIATKVTGGFANLFALEAIGSSKLSLPLPGNCTLLTNAISFLVHPTDANGELTFLRKVSTYKNLSTLHQFLPLGL